MRLIVFSIFFYVLVLAQPDYYAILEISKDGSHNEVVKAHKRLSDIYHPSKNPGNREAARKYESIQRAYEILSDWNKRHVYNQQGEGMVKTLERHQKAGRKENEQRTRDSMIEWNVSLEDLYKGTKIKFTLNKFFLSLTN